MIDTNLCVAARKCVKLSKFRGATCVGFCAFANALKPLEDVVVRIRAERSRDFWIKPFCLPDILDGLHARQVSGQFFDELA